MNNLTLRETLTYLIIYVGAIAILFLFVVIMINIKLAELEAASIKGGGMTPSGNSKNHSPLAFILTSILLVSIELFSVVDLLSIIVKLFDFLNLSAFSQNSYALSNNTLTTHSWNFSWDVAFRQFDQLSSIGIIIYTSFSSIIFILAIILLLAIVGPILLTLKPAKPMHPYSQHSPLSSAIDHPTPNGGIPY